MRTASRHSNPSASGLNPLQTDLQRAWVPFILPKNSRAALKERTHSCIMRSSISIHDPANGNPLQVPPDANIVWSSAANWHGLTAEQYRFFKAFETPEFDSLDHHIVLRLSPPALVEVRIDGKENRQMHGPGDLSLFPAGVPRRVRTKQAHEVLIIAVSQTLIQAASDSNRARIDLVQHPRFRNGQIEHLGRALKTEAESNYMSGALYGESLGLALAAHLVKNFADDRHVLRQHKGGIARLGRVLEYIHDNLADELSMCALAGIAELSPFRFAHNFKGAMNVSPHQYVIHARVERGKRLLRETAMSVIEISYAVGCQSPSRFALIFKRETGISPAHYRRLVR
jgi:AraC family transcriptional regulator